MFGTHANDVLSFDRYAEALSPTFFATFSNTLWVGIAGTMACLVIGLPVAYWMAVKVAPAQPRPAARAGDGALLDELPGAHHRLAGDPRPAGLAVRAAADAAT